MTRSLYKPIFISRDILRKVPKDQTKYYEFRELQELQLQQDIENENSMPLPTTIEDNTDSELKEPVIITGVQENTGIKGFMQIKTRDRNTVITPALLGINFEVYNGRSYNRVIISHPEMFGYRLGEFIFTKRLGSYLHKKASAERLKKKKAKLLAQQQKSKSRKAKAKLKGKTKKKKNKWDI